MESPVLKAYAEQVSAATHLQPGVDPIAHMALGLAGESGEVADLVKKSQYRRSGGLDTEAMREEAGDALWYLQSLCRLLGVTLEQLAIMNVIKLERRAREYGDVDSPYASQPLIDLLASGVELSL